MCRLDAMMLSKHFSDSKSPHVSCTPFSILVDISNAVPTCYAVSKSFSHLSRAMSSQED